jgi:twitching motility protein PilT
VRARLADNLKAVVSLRLLINKKQNGRVPAVEVMRSTRSIQECIKDPARTHEITDLIARGRSERMQTFDQHLFDLLKANKITIEEALNTASNPTDFQTRLEMEGLLHDDGEVDAKPEALFDIEPDDRF